MQLQMWTIQLISRHESEFAFETSWVKHRTWPLFFQYAREMWLYHLGSWWCLGFHTFTLKLVWFMRVCNSSNSVVSQWLLINLMREAYGQWVVQTTAELAADTHGETAWWHAAASQVPSGNQPWQCKSIVMGIGHEKPFVKYVIFLGFPLPYLITRRWADTNGWTTRWFSWDCHCRVVFDYQEVIV